MQLPMNFGALDRAKSRKENVISIVREVIAVITLKRFAIEAGVSEQQISDALAGRDRKHFRDEWVWLAHELAPPETADRLAAEMVGDQYKQPERKAPMTADEREKALVETLKKKLGPLADELVKEAYGR